MKAKVEKIYQLSNMEKGMLYHALEDKDSKAYFESMILEITGNVDVKVIEQSFNEIIKRHEVLRASFNYKTDEPLHVVLSNRKIEFGYEDVSEYDSDKKDLYIKEYLKENEERGFDLTKDVLIRGHIFKIDEEAYRLVLSFHHIVIDGWSFGIIMKELFIIYSQITKGQNVELKEVKPYSDYIKWLSEQDVDNGLDYWNKYLDGYTTEVKIPTLSTNVNNKEYNRKEKNIKLSKELTNKVLDLAKRNNVTINTVLQSVWGVILAKYNSSDDVVFGSVTSGRNMDIDGVEDMVGLFINTIPTRIRCEDNDTFKNVLKKSQEESVVSNCYNYMNLADIQSLTPLRNNLINHIMVFENYAVDEADIDDVGFKVNNVFGEELTNYSFNILAGIYENLQLLFIYDGNVYDEEIINNIEAHIINIFEKVSEDETIKISDIDIISEEEKDKILHQFNDTKTSYNKNKCIYEFFEEQVEKTPNNIALVFENRELTYKEVNDKVNSLARRLMENGVRDNSIVGIMVERSVEMIVGILAILKSGGVYLPIDPEYPEERINYILENSKSQMLLTQNKFLNKMEYKVQVIDLNDEELYKGCNDNLLKASDSNNLAYVIYTSGTTGNPKGVKVKHSSVVNTLSCLQSYYPINEGEAYLLKTNYVFDVSVTEIFGWFMGGAKLVILNKGYEKEPKFIIEAIKDNAITHINFTSSMFNLFLNELENASEDDVKSLKYILTAGEALKIENYSVAKQLLESTKIENLYGPTEATIYATKYSLNKSFESNIPIGKPISNVKIYIINKNGKLSPVGVSGELCISGDCLAEGYLNNEILTSEKFIDNPYELGQKMYKTGDLARWMPDGNIEYQGRIDHQVKIRGFRIELSEIESRLLEIDNIKEATVLDKGDEGNKYLCAYYVSEKDYNVSELREELKKSLPGYMIPLYFVKLENMPLTKNGKVDRKSLLQIKECVNTGVEYETPTNELEEKLVLIWRDILKLDKIGINDDFFDIGGHSLRVVSLVAKIKKNLKVEVSVRKVFENSTIKELAKFIESKKYSESLSIKKVEEKEYYNISAAQKRLFLLNEIEKDSISYNMPTAIRIYGDLDKEKLEDVINELIDRHEALRTSFLIVNGEMVQKIKKSINYKLEYGELKERSIEDEIKAFVRPFDLKEAPLMRVKILKVNDKEHILLFDMHHIISDGVSSGILTNDFARLYNGEKLKPLSFQYKDYCQWQKDFFESDEIKKQEKYWLNTFKDDIPVLNIMTDYPRAQKRSSEGSSIKFNIEHKLKEKLNMLANENGVTMYMLLLAAYSILLSKYSGEEDIIIGSPSAGRSHEEMKDVVGMFVNTLAMRNYPKGDKSFKEYLYEVKNNSIKAYENQDYQFDELVEKLNLERDESRNPIFDTMFSLQNFEEVDSSVEGMKFEVCEFDFNVAKFDLALSAKETTESINFEMGYCSKLFKRETIERMLVHFKNILNEVCNNPEILLKDINIISYEEEKTLLYEFTGKDVEFERDKTIYEKFKDEVENAPDNIAVVFEDKKLTYKQLKNKADQLGMYLREKGIGKDDVVALMVGRNLNMAIGIIGIIASGGAFLPIDPETPSDRISYMLEDSRTKILLTEDEIFKTKNLQDECSIEKIDINDEEIFSRDIDDMTIINGPKNLAYIIYTSGTTGKPKGVQLEHTGIINILNYYKKELRVGNGKKVLQFASIAFDVCVSDFCLSVLVGGELHIVTNEIIKDINKLNSYIKKNKINIITVPPFIAANLDIEDTSLEMISTGGSESNKKLADKIGKKIGYVNGYGPTESTICITRWEYDKERDIIPIGKPIYNTQVYILDKYNKLVPIGVPGELCVSGAGLSRGYLNRAELNEEKFIQNPYNTSVKMYRTGDIARWMPDGNIEFFGRVDNQVKIRGYRIELGEIKAEILKHENIKDAVVIPRKDKNNSKYICSYITLKNYDDNFDNEKLKDMLRINLPEYMIPTFIITLKEFKLTINGKIDIKALPEPNISELLKAEYEAPRNDIERKIVKVWCEVLGVDNIGINNNFFQVGGDSIKALQIGSKLARYNLKLEIKHLFDNPKIKDMSRYVISVDGNKNANDIVEGNVELTPIQKAYLQKNRASLDHFNQAYMLFRKDGFNEVYVKKVFNKLLEHHDALRMIYKEENNEIVQVNRKFEENLFDFDIYDIKDIENDMDRVYDLTTKIQKEISIMKGNLVKVCILKGNDGDHLLIIIHHLIVDGVSWRIIFEDFENLYSQSLNGEELNLPLKTDSYKKFSSELRKYAKGYKLEKEKNYWRNIIKEKANFIPKDNEILDSKFEDSKAAIIKLSSEKTQELLYNSSKAYNTQINDILLTALSMATREMTKENKIKINLEGHGRESFLEDVDISRTVGWFTSVYPVLINLGDSVDIANNIKTVKETLRKIPNKGIGYGIFRYLCEEELQVQEGECPILFNYLGVMDSDINREEFKESELPIGQCIGEKILRNNSLEINSAIRNNQLVITTIFNEKEYSYEIIDEFNKKYIESIEKVINHCINKKESEKTPSDYGDTSISLKELEEIKEKYGTKIEKIYPLANMEECMLFHVIHSEDSRAYFEQTDMYLKGNIDIDILNDSFNELMDRHEILRSSFEYEICEKHRHIIINDRKIEFKYFDIRNNSSEEKKALIEKYKNEDKIRGFNLSKDTLIRVCIFRSDEDKYMLILTNHHILMDGWCIGIIVADLLTIYTNKVNNNGSELQGVIPYSDYIDWLEDQNKDKALDYWKSYLAGYEEAVQIPKLSNGVNSGNYLRKEKKIHCSKELTSKILELARKNNVTLNSVVQSVWGIILSKYNSMDEVVFGSVVSGRDANVDGIESMVGLFINTIPVKIRLGNNKSIKEVLRTTQDDAIESSKYNYINLAEIQSVTSLNNNLINHVIVFENYAVDQRLEDDNANKVGFDIERIEAKEQNNYDLSLVVSQGEVLNLTFIYNGNVYDDVIIDGINNQFINVMKQAVEHENMLLKDIDIVSEEEKNNLIYTVNDTKLDYPKEKLVYELFEEYAEKTPDKIAVSFDDQELTYRELNEKANSLAWILREEGIVPDSIVAIMVEHSIEMLVGIMAILKAGGAYLPIDPKYPEERIEYILKNSEAKIVLTQGKFKDKIKSTIDIYDLNNESIYKGNGDNLSKVANENNLAYVIYTSGTTGNPKGVMIEHKALMNYESYAKNEYFPEEGFLMPVYTSVAFDLAVTSIFTPLISGNTIVIYKEKELDLLMDKVFSENSKEVIKLTPAHLSLLKEMNYVNKSIKKLIVGGEDLTEDLAKSVSNLFNNEVEIINEYGPTEATVGCIVHKYNHEKTYPNSVFIGKPIQNTRVYILDKFNKLMPIGVAGELCISGDGLARGYLNNDKLTSEKFIDNPYEVGQKMYKTGDLARWLPDGNMECLGRIDNQVKIRGYRIELGEIESNLLKIEDIKEAVVLEKDKDLCAYYVSEKEYDLKELRVKLRKNIPDYMVPSYFVKLDNMPLTLNGKIDRKSLAEKSIKTRCEYEPARNELEKKLVSIWEDILGIEGVGINSSFFEIGGHSLRATTLVSRIYKELKVKIKLSEVFERPTIKEMAELISSANKIDYVAIKNVEKKEYYDVSSAQKRIYIINKIDSTGVSYNIPLILKINGKLNITKLEKAVRELVNRHEALRTSFHMINNKLVQKIKENVEFNVKVSELNNKNIDNKIKEFIRPFNLAEAPLLRVEVIKCSQDSNFLLMDIHHIISDGVSMEIIAEELFKLYKGDELEDVNIQYKDYVGWQKELYENGKMKKQEEYWLNIFDGELPVLNMPTDYARPKVKGSEGDIFRFTLNSEISNRLTNLAKENEATLYMVLLTGYTILLSKYTGQEDIIVGSPIAGRQHEDVKHIVGVFINTLAMRNRPKGNTKLIEYLKEVKNNCFNAYENQDYAFDELVEKLNLERDTSRSALFDTMLVLQNYESKDVDIQELSFEKYEMKYNISKFDLTLTATETDEKISFLLNYSTKLFKRETIERFASHFINILDNMSKHPDEKLKDIKMISEIENNSILNKCRGLTVDYNTKKKINELFEDQVEKTPDSIAIVFGSNQITYKKLNERANKLARFIKDKNVASGEVVAIIMDESIDMIISMLAALKAGVVYLPIDSKQIANRTNEILSDSKAKILLTNKNLDSQIVFDGEVVDVNSINIDIYNSSNMENNSGSDSNIYLIYTSGSTGKPKGVMVKNSNLVNYINWFVDEAKISQQDKTMLMSSYAFDLGYTIIYSALLKGCELHITKKELYTDPMRALKYIEVNNISYIKLTPALFNIFVNDSEFKIGNGFKNIRLVILGGEKINVEDLGKLFNKYSDILVMNHYGPTETTIGAVYKIIDCNEFSKFRNLPVIGKPINNVNAYIIDKDMNLLPDGVYGELAISGAGVSNGYLNRQDITNSSFIYNPFEAGGKLYKTGDIARRLENGDIELQGRIDNQVKIRGYRIEVGEIENQLLKNEYIKEAIVSTAEDKFGNKILCAYITANKDITFEEFREYLKKKLPEYMIPSYMNQLEKMPMTENGKIDRKALPKVDFNTINNDKYEAPRNDIERKIVNIWEEVLGVDNIGIKNNFFVLGGDSIKALQIISRMRMDGMEIQMKDLFENPEIKSLNKYIKLIDNENEVDEIIEGEIGLTPIQKAYFITNKEEINYYNQATMLFRKDGFNKEFVEKVFTEIIRHHDALRMIFKIENDKIIQYNRGIDEKLFEVEEYNVSNKENEQAEVRKISEGLQNQINIAEGKLIKVAIFKTREGDHLLIIVHHLVIDGVSWRILFEDLALGYRQLINNEKLKLYSKSDSYKNYSLLLNEYSKSRQIEKEKEYWQNEVCSKKIEFLKPKTCIEKFRYEDFDSLDFVISKNETQKLLRETNRAYNTEINDILISALMIANRKTTSKNILKIDMEGHGRESAIGDIDIRRTIGWFTSKYPVLIDLKDEKEISMNIKMVKEKLRKIPNKGIGYGILRYLVEDDIISNSQRSPILFNYLGQIDEDINNDIFASSLLDSGRAIGKNIIRNNPLEVTAIVINGELIVKLMYNTLTYEKNDIERFKNNYKEAILEVISHCVNKKESEKTPYDYGDKYINLSELDKIKERYKNYEIEKIYPLANMQMGMLFHALKNKDSKAYVEQILLDINGYVNEKIFEDSFNEVMNRHEILRTSIEYDITTEPKNVIIQNRKVEFKYIDLREKTFEESSRLLQQYIVEDKIRGFDLGKDTLMRVELIRMSNDNYKVIWSNHHIIFDGWGRGILLSELLNIYAHYLNKKEYNLEESKPYSNYIKWLELQDKHLGKEYWNKYLSGYEDIATIPKMSNTIQSEDYKYKERVIEFSEDWTRSINNLANKNNATLNTVLQMIWGIILAKYNNRNDVVFGKVVSGRNGQVEGIERMVGIFINTIPTRCKFSSDESFVFNLKKLQHEALECNKYDYMNLSEIQSQSKLKQNLMDHVIVFENYAVDDMSSNNDNEIGFSINEMNAKEQNNYDFTIVAVPGKSFKLKLIYNENKYEDKIIRNIENHIRKVSNQIINNVDIKIEDIEITSEEEKKELLNVFNNTETQYEKNKTIYELFEEQVERTPYEVAVSFGDKSLTYKELNERSNRLARMLREKGVRANKIVGIMLHASEEMIIGIMGILKAGGAYLPIDPNYPEERKQYMLSDSKAEMLLVDNIENVNFDKEVISISQDLIGYSLDNLDKLSSSDDLVYIIYTSGSTGLPKGVMIKQKGLVNYITWANKSYVRGDKINFPLYSSFSFDLTVTSIFTPLINGNSIVIYRDNNNELLIRRIFKENKVGIVKLTPAHLSIIKDMDNKNCSIKRLIVGGEDLKSQLAKEVYESFDKKVEIYNEYGPTETVVGCMIHKYDYENDRNISVPIGRPADNTQIYVLDENMNTVPIGVRGEIYIGGDGVAKGYLNKPELTSKSFIENPFKKGEKLYKTGDIARFLLDGTIEYLGRNDNQVKIRGYRIETGEIEDKLLSNEKIKEAIVVPRNDKYNNKYLCAYIVVYDEAEENILAEIKESLRRKLPNYMVPAYFVGLKELPLTTNGKVDRNLLPEPGDNIIIEAEYEEPRNELEKTLVSIWEDILEIKGIGINNNLFELGANSLNIISFVNKLSEKLKYRVPFKDVFENQTIKSFSSFLENANSILEDCTIDYVQLTKSNDSNKVIFCLPPVASVAIGYMEFAKYLEGYSVYSFNFIKEETRCKEYVKLMREIQKEGPYILLGYSSGGNLAFDIAKELNKQGCQVDHVILLDSRFRTESEPHSMSEEEWKKTLYEKYKIEQYKEAELLVSDYLIDTIMSYLRYVDGSKTTGVINGNITFIDSEKEVIDTKIFKWGEATTKEFKIIQGFGTHYEMISSHSKEMTSSEADIIRNNANIVKEILEK